MGINWVGSGSVLTGAVRAVRKALFGVVRLGDVKVKGSGGMVRPGIERRRLQAARVARMDRRNRAIRAMGHSPRLANLAALLLLAGVAALILSLYVYAFGGK